MRSSRTLSRYIAREVGLYGTVGFLAFSLVLVSTNAIRHVELLSAVELIPADALQVVGCLFAMLAPPAVPMAFLFGILLGVGRLSGDNEILAMQASGLGLRSVLVPVLVLAVLITAASAWLILSIEPAAKRALRDVKVQVATRGVRIEPGKFYRRFDDRVLFAQSAEDGTLHGVLVSDRSDPARPLLIFAETGSISFDPDNARVHLLLESGEMHIEPQDLREERYRHWTFETVDYVFDVSDIVEARSQLKPREMTVGQLREVIARADRGEMLDDLRDPNPQAYRLELHERLALPFASLVFALVGVPLALRRGRGARSAGALLSLVVIFVYYVLITLGESLGERGVLPPVAALWTANVGFAIASIPLLRHAARRGP